MKSKMFLSRKQMSKLNDLGIFTNDSRYVRLVDEGKQTGSYILREKVECGQEYEDAYSFEDILHKLPLMVNGVDKSDGKPLQYDMSFHGYRDTEIGNLYSFSYIGIRFAPCTSLLPGAPYFLNLHPGGGISGRTPLEAAFKTLNWFIYNMPQELNL